MSEKYPKILVINSSPVGEYSNTGITLLNLLGNWPADRIMQVCYCDATLKTVENSPDFFTFPKNTVPIDSAIRRMLAKDISANKSTLEYKVDNNVFQKNKSLHEFFKALLDVSPVILQPETIKLIDQFKPEVIYSNLSSIRLIKTVRIISNRYAIKPVLHFMDDWPTTLYSTNRMTKWAHSKMRNELLRLVNRTDYSLTISELMAKEYTSRYKKEFFAISNPIPLNIYKKKKLSKNKKKTIVYCGGLHLERWKSLEEVAEVFNDLGNEFFDWEFKIYTPKKDFVYYKKFLKDDKILNWTKELEPEEVDEVLENSDILLHIESFDSGIMKFTKYSFSTKIPQYMSSGKPILAYGPENLASTQFIREKNVGNLATNKKEIKKHLIELMSNSLLRNQLGNNGIIQAKNKFEKNYLQGEFLNVVKHNCK